VSNGIVFLAEGRNSPVVAGDRVFATAPVHAFDAATGSELWRSACEPDVRLCSLNAATGAVIWSARIDDRLRLGEPAVDARTVVTTCGDGLCAFDRGTGERVWRTPDELGCDRAHGTGCHPIIANGVVYAPSADGLIRTYSVRLGAPLARFQVGARPTVIVADGTMFTTTGRGVRAYRLPTAEG
jgi:outer membrane protein assembly factor BamB